MKLNIYKISFMFFINALVCCNSKIVTADDFCTSYKNLKIIYVSSGNTINVWDCQTQKSTQLYKERDVEHLIQPCLAFDNTKLLFAKNYIHSGVGEIIVYDLKEKNKKIIHKVKFAIREFALSPSEKIIAFLSNYNHDTKSCSLYLLNLKNKSVEKVLHKEVRGVAYYTSISWFPDSKQLAFLGDNGRLNVLDIMTKKIKKLGMVRGYNPKINQGGDKVLYIQKNIINTPIPTVHDLNRGSEIKVSITRVRNAIWSPCSDRIIIVRNDSSPLKYFDFSEWHREVIVYNLNSKESKTLFQFEGFSDIGLAVGEFNE